VIEHIPKELFCSQCGSREVWCRGVEKRVFRAIPIGGKPVFFQLDVQRVQCRACNTVRQVRLGFADPRRTYTRGFERYAVSLLRHMTIKDVAVHLGVSWDTIKDIQKRRLRRRFSRPKLKHLRRIAIDEICIGRGYQYLTVVLDLQSGAVVYVGDGKGSEALVSFWKRLRSSGARVKAVAIDMSPAYIEAVRNNLPRAAIVFDHCHQDPPPTRGIRAPLQAHPLRHHHLSGAHIGQDYAALLELMFPRVCTRIGPLGPRSRWWILVSSGQAPQREVVQPSP
jgi:transposase